MHNQQSQVEQIILEEVSRNYRTEIPNVVFEMVLEKEITANEFMLYSVYRRIAGEHGSCFATTKTLAEMTGLSKNTVIAAKRTLSRPFKKLFGKSLIKITPGDRKSQQTDVVVIMDVWPENQQEFKNNVRCPKRGSTPPPNEGVPPLQNRDTKNEQVKKELIKKVSKAPIVHKSPNSDPPVRTRSASPPSSGIAPTASKVSASPTPAEGSNSFSTEKREESSPSLDADVLDNPDMLELLTLEPQYIEYFRPKIVGFWIKKYGPSKVLAMIKYFFTVKGKQKRPIFKPEAWMEDAFKQDYNQEEEIILHNKQYAEEMKRKYNCRYLKINKRYCLDTLSGDSAYYNLPTETFKYLIEKFCEDA
jgi:helix-turn-helix protein